MSSRAKQVTVLQANVSPEQVLRNKLYLKAHGLSRRAKGQTAQLMTTTSQLKQVVDEINNLANGSGLRPVKLDANHNIISI